jgi:putative transposase
MERFNNKYRIDSTRLKNHDYSSEGDYYVTICTGNYRKTFGKIVGNKMSLSESGFAALKHWVCLPDRFPEIKLGEFVFMPEHMHGIVRIIKNGGKSLSEIIGSFKSISSKEIGRVMGIKWGDVWQKRFFDRIIRGDFEYYFVTEYIKNNPLKANPENYYKEWYELEEIRNKQP